MLILKTFYSGAPAPEPAPTVIHVTKAVGHLKTALLCYAVKIGTIVGIPGVVKC